jgi:hypothetical protein
MSGPSYSSRWVKFNSKSNSNRFESFKFLIASKMAFLSSKNLNKNMVLKILNKWITFSIEATSYSEWISNKKSENSLG